MNKAGRIADNADLRARNLARVLSEIRRRGETSRTDIAEALELSPATVGVVIADLLAADLVREAKSPAAGRGRPKVSVSLNPEARHVAGAKLSDGAVTVAILNFTGEILGDVSVPLDHTPIEPETLLDTLTRGLEQVLDKVGLPRDRLAALGLGVPGFVDVTTGFCHWSPVLRRGAIELRPLLAARLGCPVFIDNDANLATLAELWFGHGRDARDFLVVTIEHGVGLGVVLDGALFRGARGLGAEFGHTKVQIEGALCRCGQRGCLEAYVADYAIAREAGAALAQQPHLAGGPDPLARLSALARGGDEIAATIYRRAGRMLGLGLANLVNLFDPSMIVISGERISNHQLLAAEMERTLRDNVIATARPPAEMRVHLWGDALWARGAGALAMDGLMRGAPAG